MSHSSAHGHSHGPIRKSPPIELLSDPDDMSLLIWSAVAISLFLNIASIVLEAIALYHLLSHYHLPTSIDWSNVAFTYSILFFILLFVNFLLFFMTIFISIITLASISLSGRSYKWIIKGYFLFSVVIFQFLLLGYIGLYASSHFQEQLLQHQLFYFFSMTFSFLLFIWFICIMGPIFFIGTEPLVYLFLKEKKGFNEYNKYFQQHMQQAEQAEEEEEESAENSAQEETQAASTTTTTHRKLAKVKHAPALNLRMTAKEAEAEAARKDKLREEERLRRLKEEEHQHEHDYGHDQAHHHHHHHHHD